MDKYVRPRPAQAALLAIDTRTDPRRPTSTERTHDEIELRDPNHTTRV
jgi:hypothetical protein